MMAGEEQKDIVVCSRECRSILGTQDLDSLAAAFNLKVVEADNFDVIGKGDGNWGKVTMAVLALLTADRLSQTLANVRALATRKDLFIIVLCSAPTNTAVNRLVTLKEGAVVFSENPAVVEEALKLTASCACKPELDGGKPVRCVYPGCNCAKVCEGCLELHYNLYHSGDPNVSSVCPLCDAPSSCLGVHLREWHVEKDRALPKAHPCSLFAWVVVRNPLTGLYLLVNEPTGLCRNKGPLYWLPAGQVDEGESFAEAAIREVKEEAGIDVRLTGILRFIGEKGIVFAAEPLTPSAVLLKEIPDYESLGATWASLPEVLKLDPSDFRDKDPAELFPLLEHGRSCPFPEDNSAFSTFEAAVKTITSNEAADTETCLSLALQAKWQVLKQVFPAELFHAFY